MKNVYGMYFANEKRVGYWIQRESWGQTIAQVVHIDPWKGPPPYFGNPKVYADYYRWNSTRGKWVLVNSREEIRCPGNFTYSMIKPPEEGTYE